MKNSLTLLIALILFSCQDSKKVKISGTITNSDYKHVVFSNLSETYNASIPLNEDGTFSGTLELDKEGMLYFQNGTGLYLTPGADLIVELDVEAADTEGAEYLKISGKGSDASNLVYDILDNSYNYLRKSKEHYTSTIPDYFKQCVDSVSLTNKDAFNDFREYRRYIISRHGRNVFETIKAENIKYGTIAFFNRNIDLIVAIDAEQAVKDELGNNLLRSYPRLPDSTASIVLERYPEVLKNEKYIAKFNRTLEKLEKLKTGNAAPGFSYPDINGETVTLDDLKGKIVYIDIWATWCGPCKGEIPALKKLEKELHGKDIAFVSISVDQKKDAWEKMVKDEKLQGIQLHTSEGWNARIMKDYVISGIPRFILIDKEGNLINANAPRPSNPRTKDNLLDLLADS